MRMEWSFSCVVLIEKLPLRWWIFCFFLILPGGWLVDGFYPNMFPLVYAQFRFPSRLIKRLHVGFFVDCPEPQFSGEHCPDSNWSPTGRIFTETENLYVLVLCAGVRVLIRCCGVNADVAFAIIADRKLRMVGMDLA